MNWDWSVISAPREMTFGYHGILEFTHLVPGVDCPTCETVSGQHRVVPCGCPRSMLAEIERFMCRLRDEHRVLDPAELDELRWKWSLSESARVTGVPLNAGNCFASAAWRYGGTERCDLYWPVSGSALFSARLRSVFEEAGVSGLYFEDASHIDDGRYCGEPSVRSDDRDEADTLRISELKPSVCVVKNSTWEVYAQEFGAVRCHVCGIATCPPSRLNDYNRCRGIARSRRRLPKRWIVDCDVFESHVFGQGALVVRRWICDLLQKVPAKEFLSTSITIEE